MSASRGTAAAPLTVLLVTLAFHASAALFADQDGEVNWHQTHLGIPAHASFSPLKPRACLVTQQHTVGCVNLRDGSIAWRKRFGDGETLDALLQLDKPAHLVTASKLGPVRAFDASEGFLVWERQLASKGAVLLSGVAAGDSGTHLIVVAPGMVQIRHVGAQVLDAADGATLSSTTVSATAGSDQLHMLPSTSSQRLAVAGYSTGSSEVFTALLEGGSALQAAASSPARLSGVSASGAAGLAALSEDNTQLCFLPVTGDWVWLVKGLPTDVQPGLKAATKSGDGRDAFGAVMACHSVAELAPSLPSAKLRLLATANGFVLFSTAGGAALLQASSGSLSLLSFHPSATSASAPVVSDRGEVLGLMSSDAAGTLSLSAVLTSTGGLIHSEKVLRAAAADAARLTSDSAMPGVGLAALGTYRRKDRSDGFRLLVGWDDGQLSLVQQGVSVWTRDEALSALMATMFVDLPADKHDLSMAAPGSSVSMSTRVRLQLLGAKVQLKLNDAAEHAEYVALKAAMNDKNKAIRDPNGFRKIILAASATGKLLALHNGDGRTLWAHNFGPDAAPKYLLPWRTFHDTQHAPQVLVVHATAPPTASVVNSHTGRILEVLTVGPADGQCKGSDKVVRVSSRLHEGVAEQEVYMHICSSEDGSPPVVSLLPDTLETRAFFATSYRSVFFWMLDAAGRVLTGYGFDRHSLDTSSAGSLGSSIPSAMTWRLSLPDPVLGLAARNPAENIQTSVKVLGDRSIKYRYLNPNTLLLVTGSGGGNTDPSEAGSVVIADGSDAVDEPEASKLTVYLLDTVSGRVLHRRVHPGACGPVAMLLTENFAVYQYWDAVSTRFAMTSLEMFDASPRDFSVLDYLFNPNSTLPVSSYHAAPIEVTSLSVWARLPAKALATTTTARGITAKMILIATTSDQVYGMDQRLMDPRRPRRTSLTAEQQEERLILFQDTLPINPLGFSTYDQQVLGLRTIKTEAARLESTTLVFAYGIDLFYTRLTPSRAFDSLEDDFSYGLLIVALVALLVGSCVMQHMTKQALLKSKWK
ncbi:MAG: hypothetical protein WDW36_005311 [Sanguina aurantia]